MIILPTNEVVHFLGQIHSCQIIVCFQQFVDSVSYKLCLLLERTEFLGVDEEVAKLVSIDIFF
jgi:hypothetical protein